MTALELVENYYHHIDVATVIFCIVIGLVIRFGICYSADKKFMLVKIAVVLIFTGSISNVIFEYICKTSANQFGLYYFRALNHICFMISLYLFMLYLKDLLGLKDKYVIGVAHITRIIFVVFTVLDLFSGVTEIGFCYTEQGWKDTMFSFYNGFYLYSVFLLVVMLLFYSHRLIKSVRLTLTFTEIIIALIMTKCAFDNTNTYTSLTYILPVIIVLITLHSNPIDSKTGAMSYRSFTSYVEKNIKKKISMDFLVLQLKNTESNDLPLELGKVLTTFWYDYYSIASFFVLDNDCYVLVIPKVLVNGDTYAIMNNLIHKVFPKYYEIFNLTYKVVGMPDIDFANGGAEVNYMIDYLFKTMEDNSVCILDEDQKDQLKMMYKIRKQLLDIENRQDLDDERVLAYCQPIRNTETGKYDTAEALLRLSIPDEGLFSPTIVIPLAEELGCIHILTKIMLNKVCKELKLMEEEGYSFNRVSVNIAAMELREPGVCNDIIDIIESNGIDPSKIGIELTESQNESDFMLAKEKISKLKNQGMTIYLDDYGTGYSNFERVIKLGFDVVKFDRSILLSAQKDGNVLNMVKSLSESFGNMNYKILFEGVETVGQIDVCNVCGADYLQGFEFSRPIPIAEVREFFEK